MCHDDYEPLGAIVFSPWQAKVNSHHDNASDDDDFVAKDSARALQSLFRSSDGYDEELARVQRGETEDGDDLYD